MQQSDGIAGLLASWWSEGPRYSERLALFETRGLLRAFRVVVSMCALLLGGVSFGLFVADDAVSSIGWIVQLGGAAVGGYWAVRWLIGAVPSLRTATAFTFTSSAAICLVSAVDLDVMTGAFGLSSLSLTATFAAIMLRPTLFLAHEVVIVAAIAYFSAHLLAQYGVALAVAKTVVLLIAAVGVPSSVQIWMAFLAYDAALSFTDPMCGTLNRRGFLRAAAARVAEQDAAIGAEVAVVAFDLDQYKAINDRHGHAIGDAVLVGVAQIAREHIRPNQGVIGRVGGDEFAMYLSGMSAADYVRIAEQVRAEVEAAEFGNVRVTVSLGVATERISDVTEPINVVDRLRSRADIAMYRSKTSRNCVTRFIATDSA